MSRGDILNSLLIVCVDARNVSRSLLHRCPQCECHPLRSIGNSHNMTGPWLARFGAVIREREYLHTRHNRHAIDRLGQCPDEPQQALVMKWGSGDTAACRPRRATRSRAGPVRPAAPRPAQARRSQFAPFVGIVTGVTTTETPVNRSFARGFGDGDAGDKSESFRWPPALRSRCGMLPIVAAWGECL